MPVIKAEEFAQKKEKLTNQELFSLREYLRR